MSKPLFILQSLCADRLACVECRSDNARYRQGWAERYEMPPDWPTCPRGFEMGYKGNPKPVPPAALGLTVDQPDSSEAKAIMARVNARADFVRPICQQCPHFNKLYQDGLTVDCDKGYRCCDSRLSRGNVYLGSGACLMGFWDKR